MSFILDALKKSESERHRHSGPVLMDVRIAPPRRRIPAWAWVIVAVLAVNLGVLGWLLWPGRHAAADAPGADAGAPAAAQAAPPAQTATAPAGPAAQPAMPAPNPALATTVAPAAAEVAAPGAPPTVLAPGTSALPAATAAPGSGASAPLPAPALPAQPIDITTLPKVADMVAAGVVLPELRLSLHVYDPAPQNRYVLLNGARLREGDFTAEGVRVIAIMPTGVVVEWRNRRMFLGAGA